MAITRTHIFPTIFNSYNVQMENTYVFNVFPIYWETEIIPGLATLIGNATIEINPDAEITPIPSIPIVLPLITACFTSSGCARTRADYVDEGRGMFQMWGDVLIYFIQEE